MSEAYKHHSLSVGATAKVEDAALSFWQLWHEGQRPDAESFVASAGPIAVAELVKILRVDQRERWLSGEPCWVESYLRRFPPVRTDSENTFDLIYSELLLRMELGQDPDLSEYEIRFPEYANRMRLQLELHRALDGETSDDLVEPVPPAETESQIVDTNNGSNGRATNRSQGSGQSVPGYEIQRELGRGGMGVVYLARQTSLNRLVALKVMLLPGNYANSEQMARFQSEAEAAARLQHANIVEIHEIGERAGILYFSMDFVDGGSLAQSIKTRTWAPSDCARLVATLAEAMHYAHQQGVIHRDLKPANVLLTRGGVAKITDFGLAKQCDDEHDQTLSGTILGTPSYMAPEQATGQVHEIGPATDVHALGAILYELLAGKPPFQAGTSLVTLRQVMEEDPVPPTKIQRRIPRDLEIISLKCLEKNPARRYPSAQELADDLKRFLEGQPIRAQKTRLPRRIWRWCRRKPALAIAACLATLLLGSLGPVFYLGAVLNRGQQRAQEGSDSAVATFERGMALCERGDVSRGMLFLADGLEVATQARRPDLSRAIRLNLSGWSCRLHPLKALLETRGPVQTVAFSPDGRFVLTGSDDGNVQCWDAADGNPVGPPIRHEGIVRNVAFSRDGRRFATACGTVVRIWETATHRSLDVNLVHEKEVMTTDFSPDGQTMVTGDTGGAARMWNVQTGKRIGPVLRHEEEVRAAIFSPDGHTVLTASQDRTAKLWTAKSGAPLLSPIIHDDMLFAAAFSPDGKTFATGGNDCIVRLYETATGNRKPGAFRHQAGIYGIAFSPDGRRLLTGGFDTTARLWAIDSETPIGTPLFHPDRVSAVAFGPDGRTAVTASMGNARLWQMNDGRPASRVLNHTAFVRQGVFNPQGDKIVTGSEDGTVQIWDAQTGDPLGPPLRHQGGRSKRDSSVDGLAVSSDGRWIVSGCRDRTACVWDAVTGKRLSLLKHSGPVVAVAFHPNGHMVLTASEDNRAQLWNASTGQPIGEPLRHNGRVHTVAFNSDGSRMLTASEDNTAQIWDVATGKPVGPPLKHTAAVRSAVFSPDDSLVLTASMDWTGQLWDATAGVAVGAPLQHEGPVPLAAFGPDGFTILTGSYDRTARFWDARRTRPLGPPLHHNGLLRALVFGRNTRMVLTGSYDKTARLWDLATKMPIGPALLHENQVWFVAFSPDEKHMLTGGQETAAHLWSTPAYIEGDAERIILWIRTATGMQLDAEGTAHLLDARAWRQSRARLAELGGPPNG
jgi:WD40 repeat protein